MKKNYQIELEKVLDSLDSKKSLLLHVCCGPCSSYVLEYLHKYFDITVLFYNPNIDEEEEYLKRLDELKRLVKEMKLDVEVISKDYDHGVFLDLAKGLEEENEGGKRCTKCFYERLRESFKYAKEKNYDYVTTSLTISPYKNSEVINNLGKKLSNEFKIAYLYSDFKKKNGYKRSIELSKEHHLYRQDYCGCEFSRRESEIRHSRMRESSK